MGNWWQGWSRGRKVAGAGIMAVLLVVAVALLIFLTGGPGSGRLLDGTRVTLEQATYGTNHVSRSSELDPLMRRLPAKWRDKLGWNPGVRHTVISTSDVYVFWLALSRTTTNLDSLTLAIADESGLESAMIYDGPYRDYGPPGFGVKRYGLMRGTSTFPSRSAKFFLRIYQQDATGRQQRVGEFAIRNLARRPAATWAAKPLPAEERTNQLGFALTQARVGIPPPGPLVSGYTKQIGEWCEFRFRVTSGGQPADGWRIRELWISEESGNKVRMSGEDRGSFNGLFCREDHGELVCVHRWEFWADRPAWKLRVHFEKPGQPDFWAEYVVKPEFIPPPAS